MPASVWNPLRSITPIYFICHLRLVASRVRTVYSAYSGYSPIVESKTDASPCLDPLELSRPLYIHREPQVLQGDLILTGGRIRGQLVSDQNRRFCSRHLHPAMHYVLSLPIPW